MRRILTGLVVLIASLGHAQVTSVFGRTGAVTANTGDYTAAKVTNAVDTTQTYSNPSWLTSIDWTKITNLPLIITGTNNVAAGQYALFSNGTTGQSDSAVGHAALYYNTGNKNTAVGDAADAYQSTGDNNTAVGAAALGYSGTQRITGCCNTAIGADTLASNFVASDQVAIGHAALNHNTCDAGSNPDVHDGTACANTAVGKDSQNFSGTAQFNTSLGQDAMWGGSGNTAPSYSCSQNTGSERFTGSKNVALGQGAFCNVDTGNNNVCVGWEACVGMKTGNDNVVVGKEAGLTAGGTNQNVSGSGNVWIGTQAGPSTTTQLSNSIAIGNSATNSASNQVQIGNTSVLTSRLGTPQSFASLPACSSSIEGATSAVTDSTTNTWGATITGGGVDHVWAYCDGTNWTVIAR